MSTYTVQSGDSLWNIAEEQLGNGQRWKEIKCKNRKLTDDQIYPGDILILPTSASRINTHTASNQDDNYHYSSNDKAALISTREFDKAITSNSYSKQDHKYNDFIQSLKHAAITTKDEAAMYLATLLHESRGLSVTTEEYNQQSVQMYGEYIGRGYIQLSSKPNYESASDQLGHGNLYVRNPQIVSEDPHAWNVSAWYWKNQVHQHVRNGFEEVVTRGIRPAQPNMSNRRTIYAKVCKAFNI